MTHWSQQPAPLRYLVLLSSLTGTADSGTVQHPQLWRSLFPENNSPELSVCALYLRRASWMWFDPEWSVLLEFLLSGKTPTSWRHTSSGRLSADHSLRRWCHSQAGLLLLLLLRVRGNQTREKQPERKRTQSKTLILNVLFHASLTWTPQQQQKRQQPGRRLHPFDATHCLSSNLTPWISHLWHAEDLQLPKKTASLPHSGQHLRICGRM